MDIINSWFYQIATVYLNYLLTSEGSWPAGWSHSYISLGYSVMAKPKVVSGFIGETL